MAIPSHDVFGPHEGCYGVLVVPERSLIPFLELKGSPREGYQGQKLRVTRDFLVLWQDRWDFVIGMCGDAERVPLPNDNTRFAVKRIAPHSYPEHPTLLNQEPGKGLYATHVEAIEGVAPANVQQPVNDVFQYDYAKIRVIYETLTYAVLDEHGNDANDLVKFPGTNLINEAKLQRYVTRIMQPSAESVTIANGHFLWVTGPLGGKPVIGSNTRIESAIEVHYVWHQVPGKPDLRKLPLGKVNAQGFDSYFDEDSSSFQTLFPAGTLLFLAMELRPYRLGSGRRVADITYKMKYFEPQPGKGHNYFLAHKIGEKNLDYHLISADGTNTGQRVYLSGDFETLFNPVDEIYPFEA